MYVLDRGPESGMCCSFVLSARRFQNTLAGNEIELAPPQTGSRFLFIQWQAQIMILIASDSTPKIVFVRPGLGIGNPQIFISTEVIFDFHSALVFFAFVQGQCVYPLSFD